MLEMQTPPRGSRSISARYDRLLGALERAHEAWDLRGGTGRCVDLQEAANIVFELLYTLDYDKGGELVPRLAGVYAFLADELLTIGRTRDRTRLFELRRVVGVLRTAT